MKAVKSLELRKVKEDIDFKHINFNSPGVELNILGDNFNSNSVIVFNQGSIEKDLVINGHNRKIKELRLVDCLVKKTVFIFNLQVEKIKINGDIKNIILTNVDFQRLNIKGNIYRMLILDNLINKNSKIVIEGKINGIVFRNVETYLLNLENTDCNFIKGQKLKVKKLLVPSGKASFKKITINHLSLIKKIKTKIITA
jgi:hypothetical protein